MFNCQVRNLKWLGFRVPLAIVNKAHQANQLYPFAISLIESVRTYERTCEKVILTACLYNKNLFNSFNNFEVNCVIVV